MFADFSAQALLEYTCAFSLKFPQFCYSERHWFGKDPVFSLIAANNKSFLLCIFGLIVSLAQLPPRREHSFQVPACCWQAFILQRFICYVTIIAIISHLEWVLPQASGELALLSRLSHIPVSSWHSRLPPILGKKKNPRAPPLLSFSF